MIGSSILMLVLSYVHVSLSAFSTVDNYGESKFGEWTVRNDNWGPGAPPQTMTAQSGTSWCVDSSAGSQCNGVKSYPHSAKLIKKPLCQLKKIDSTFKGQPTIVEKGTIAYSFSYDIWLQNKKYEVMLWMHMEGAIQPCGASVVNQTIAGYSWDVWNGTNGQNLVFSFINKKSCFDGRVDLKAILDWIVEKKWITEGTNVVLDEVEFGYEITASPPKSKFCLTGFTCQVE